MPSTHHYKIKVLAGTERLDPIDDNVDVEVLFDDGARYMATFFTVRNIQKLMDQYQQTGECMKGLYFWASGLIVVRTLTRQNIAKAVGDLVGKKEFERAFSRTESSEPLQPMVDADAGRPEHGERG
jgi:hypothetical protein